MISSPFNSGRQYIYLLYLSHLSGKNVFLFLEISQPYSQDLTLSFTLWHRDLNPKFTFFGSLCMIIRDRLFSREGSRGGPSFLWLKFCVLLGVLPIPSQPPGFDADARLWNNNSPDFSDSSVPRLRWAFLTPAETWSRFRAAVNCTGLSVAHKKGDGIRIALFSATLVVPIFLIVISLLLSRMWGDTESLHQFIVIWRIFRYRASSGSWLRQFGLRRGCSTNKDVAH